MKFFAALGLLSLFFLGYTQQATAGDAAVVPEKEPIVIDAAEGNDDAPASGSRRERRGERSRRERRRERNTDDDEDGTNETET